MSLTKRIAFLFLLFLLAATPALAQDGGNAPGQNALAAETGVVLGMVRNDTPQGAVPAEGEPMLHIWDEAFNEKGMEHGRLGQDGTFRFEEVPFVSGWQYAVLLNYQGVTYFSQPVTVAADQEELALELPVYESTPSTDAVRVTSQHVLFDAAAEGQLRVAEIYVLSNEGARTVAAPEEDPDATPLRFALPPGAGNVTFEGNSEARFRLVEGGFVDTGPLRPGDGTGQVVVQYTLPYENAEGLTYTYSAPWPVEDLNVLLPAASGLSLQGEGLAAPESRQMNDGGQVALYNRGAMQAGDSMVVTLTGELLAPPPAAASAPPAAAATPSWQNQPLAPVAITLGVLLLALAVWLQVRAQPQPRAAHPAGATFDALVREIALLDQAHDQGRLNEGDYERRRSYLVQEARRLMPEEIGD